MIFDIIVLVVIIGAVFKGMQKGLVVALLTFLAFVIGAAVALKMSGVVAAYISERWPDLGAGVPFLSFMLVFVAVVIVVRLLGGVLEKGLDFVFLGWLNKLGGVAFYVLLYFFMLSILVFYFKKLGIASDEWRTTSITYPYLEALAPQVMEWLGKAIPVFKDLFKELQQSIPEPQPAATVLAATIL